MVGVWDTVKALGLRVPILWRFASKTHDFPDKYLSDVVDGGFHALAADETRAAFAPELWDIRPKSTAKVQQMWFAGAHGDIGGHIGIRKCLTPGRLAVVTLVGQNNAVAMSGN